MQMLKGDDYRQWRERNLRENDGYRLKVGDHVTDMWRRRGRVVEVRIPRRSTISDHGSLRVRLDRGGEEHYAAHGWEWKFRVERA